MPEHKSEARVAVDNAIAEVRAAWAAVKADTGVKASWEAAWRAEAALLKAAEAWRRQERRQVATEV